MQVAIKNSPGEVQELINRCIQKERTAQSSFYHIYCNHKMIGTCLWYAKNKQEAEEILQDSFIKVFTRIHT